MPVTSARLLRTVVTGFNVLDSVARWQAKQDCFESGRIAGFAAAARGEELPEIPSMPDGSLDAERVRGLEAGWREGITRQEMVCLLEGRRAGRGEVAALGAPPLDTELKRIQWAAYARGLALGRAEREGEVLGRDAALRDEPRPVALDSDPELREARESGINQGWSLETDVSA